MSESSNTPQSEPRLSREEAEALIRAIEEVEREEAAEQEQQQTTASNQQRKSA